MPAAAIVAAIIAVGGVMISAAISSSDAENAQDEARVLGETKRQDDLNWQMKKERLEKLTLKQRKRESRAQERAERERLKQHKTEFAFGQRESFFNKQMGMLNSSENMRSNFANNLFRGAA